MSKLDLARQFSNHLTTYQATNSKLEDWRFDLHETRGIEIGLKDNRLGGPYSAPSYKRSISGEVFLIWRDQHYTSAKLDVESITNFDEYITLWETTAFFDPDGVGLYRADSIPEVDLYDGQVTIVIDQQPHFTFELLNKGLLVLQKAGMSLIDGKVRCYESHRKLVDSQGFWLEYKHSPVEFYFEVNNSYGQGYQEKRWPLDTDIDRVISNTTQVGKALQQPADVNLSGRLQLILSPDIFESFLNHYVTRNLYGSSVLNRQSRFSLVDFQNQKQILRNDLKLSIDTLIPGRGFSYPCTGEGVPGGSVDFIREGRLQTPVLNLKYAKKAGMKPTPVPGGGGLFLKSCLPTKKWDELVRGVERGIIVYSVLGLHTQDSSSGKFSLTADQCLYIENGVIMGKIKGVINGDFLSSLQEDSTQLCTVDGEDNPGYAFFANFIS